MRRRKGKETGPKGMMLHDKGGEHDETQVKTVPQGHGRDEAGELAEETKTIHTFLYSRWWGNCLVPVTNHVGQEKDHLMTFG